MWVYIWTDEWLPWENTVAYYPLNSTTTVNDQSWNNRNLTNNGATFWDYWWVNCLKLSNNYLKGDVGDITQYSHTINLWANKNWWSWDVYVAQWGIWASGLKWCTEMLQRPNYIKYSFWFDDLSSTNTYSNWAWHNIVVLYDKTNTSQIMYIDGSLINSRTLSYSHYLNWTNGFVIGASQGSGGSIVSGQYFNWWISNLIIESKLWSADQILQHYNNTKSLYWIS